MTGIEIELRDCKRSDPALYDISLNIREALSRLVDIPTVTFNIPSYC